MLRLSFVAGVLAVAACRAPHPMAPGEFVVTPIYAKLFHPYEHWTYHVASSSPDSGDAANGDADEGVNSLEVRCTTDSVKPYSGGVTSHIKCNLPEAIAEDTGVYPLEGVWMADQIGLWHIHAGERPTLDNATLVLKAHPEVGHMDPDELTGDDEFAEVARDGDAWCTTHQRHLDVENYYTLCFG